MKPLWKAINMYMRAYTYTFTHVQCTGTGTGTGTCARACACACLFLCYCVLLLLPLWVVVEEGQEGGDKPKQSQLIPSAVFLRIAETEQLQLMNGRVAGEKGGKKGSKGSKPDWHSDKDKGGNGSKGKGKGKGKGKSETRYCYHCGEQGHIGVNCPYKWVNSIDEEDDQTSLWESEAEGEKTEELASLETPDAEGECCWPEKSKITRW